MTDRIIFVFGSNLAGRHGKGAALDAKKFYGAEYGVGVGPTGDAYAIPTKDGDLRVLPLDVIQGHIEDFVEYARRNPRMIFAVTPVGTGLSGLKLKTVADMFKTCNPLPENILLTATWLK